MSRPGFWRRLALLWLALAAGVALAEPLELREARASITIEGSTSAQTVTLPYNWDRENRGQAGTATFEIPFHLDELPTRQVGIYFVRLGTAYEVSLNGELIGNKGDLQQFDGDDYGQIQRFMVGSSFFLLRTMC